MRLLRHCSLQADCTLAPMGSPHSSPEAPRTTQARETSASEGWNYTRNFANTFVIHGGTRFFYMLQSWDMGQILSLPLRRKEDVRKIQRLRPGLNPRTRVPGASMLTTRPPKPSSPGVKRLELGVEHTTSSTAEVKERVGLYIYSPSVPSWPALV